MEARFHEYTPQKININKALAFADKDMNLVLTKENFCRFLGIMRGHECFYNLISEQEAESLKNRLAEISVGDNIYMQTQIIRADGQNRCVSLKITALDENNISGCPYSIELIDIVNSHDYIYDLEFKAIKYKSILENQTGLIFEYDSGSRLFNVFELRAAAEEAVFMSSIDEIKSISVLQNEDADKFSMLVESLKKGESYFEYTFSQNPFLKNAEKESIVIKGKSTVLSEGKVVVAGSICSCDKNTSADMSVINKLDMMTGLLNKSAILDIARTAIAEKKHEQVFFVMLDLDNFKMVNDTYGHMLGDKVIKRIAEILKMDVKQNGWVGRFGGDEYFLVLYDLGGEGDLRAILASICNNVENCFKDKFDGFNLSCSIGVSEYPRNGQDFDLLFKKADRGLYIAKKKGKKRYIIYKEELHGEIDLNTENEEYTEAIVTTHKFAGDIRRYQLMRDGMTALVTQGVSAVDDFMNTIIDAYCLKGISLYAGDNFEVVKSWGSYSLPMDNASYMMDSKAQARFNEKDVFWENNVQYNGYYVPIIHDKLLEHNIYATVQGIIRRDDRIIGIMTFDMEESIRNWTEEDTQYFGIISRMVGGLLL